MKLQSKDKFYDDFLKNPTKDNFNIFLKENCGELDEVDFKESWIDKGSLAKLILSMANSRGGIIVFGIKENDDGTFEINGLEELKDKAQINDSIAKYISPNLDYEVFDFCYDTANYKLVENKKFQIIHVHDTPDRLPFISLGATDGIDKDTIYVRRGTKCIKATSEDIEKMLYAKLMTYYKDSSDLTLDEHLEQLKKLYDELPKKIKVLVRKSEVLPTRVFGELFEKFFEKFKDEYEEVDNPNYPDETYEAFILRMIELKKIKIEKVLDIK